MIMKNEIATISQSVSNQTKEVNTRLSGLNESMRDDFSSTENMICNKIEEFDNQVTTQLMRMNQTLTREIFFITLRKHVGVHGVGDVQSTWI